MVYWLVGLATISYGHNFVIHKLFLISVIRWPTWFDIPWSSFLWISPICSGAPKARAQSCSQFHRHLKKAVLGRSTSNIIEIRLDQTDMLWNDFYIDPIVFRGITTVLILSAGRLPLGDFHHPKSIVDFTFCLVKSSQIKSSQLNSKAKRQAFK